MKMFYISFFIPVFIWFGFSLAQIPNPIELTPLIGTSSDGKLDNPLGMEEIPGKKGFFIIYEWEGKIVLASPTELGYVTKTLVNIRVDSRHNEKGLLGLDFHPNFSQNFKYYINYTYNDKTFIEERKLTKDLVADAGHSKVIMAIPQPWGNHNGGTVQFGPDNMLYIGTGDGGSGGDPKNYAQQLGNWLGKILRIDVDNPSGGKNYSIPSDNPFVDQKNARGEIWAYGLRNPWKFSFDRETGIIWAGDVGQHWREEITLIEKGDNLGWKIKEGFTCFNWDGGNRASWTTPLEKCNQKGLREPLVDLTRDEGASVIGGYVYRKNKNSPFYGVYFYSDYYGKNIWALREKNNKVLEKQIVARVNTPSSFAEDSEGNVYVISRNKGIVYRLSHPQF